MNIDHRYCVIMCGGVGSRFWPYSRANCPKQFIDFFGTGRTLLQMSYERAISLVPKKNVIVVTSHAYAPLVAEQIPDLDSDQMLLEPARRNTAPCITWAAYHILARDPQASIMVTPSDHLITREAEFIRAMERGFEFVEDHDALLTLGIKPTRPETGYGYIQIGEKAEEDILKVKTFTEKPDKELAQVFLDSGEFFWNSGIFLWKAVSIIEAIRTYMPDLALKFDDGMKAGAFASDAAEKQFIETRFPECASISIDYGVMERAANVFVECVDMGWSDLGTWTALYDNSPRDVNRNVTQNCRVLSYNAHGNIFAVDAEKLVVVSGLEDYVVADRDDVLLICPRSEEQKIRHYVNDVKIAYGDKYI